MGIVSSTIVEDKVQIDGRRWIRERHLLDGGAIQDYVYMAESNYDISVALMNRQATLLIELQAAEIQANADEIDRVDI